MKTIQKLRVRCLTSRENNFFTDHRFVLEKWKIANLGQEKLGGKI